MAKLVALQVEYMVQDRLGHDWHNAIDFTKAERELGWKPTETFESGIGKTVACYLGNPDWVDRVTSGFYREWVQGQYSDHHQRSYKGGT